MRWYARPEGDNYQLRVAPQLASSNKADDPKQIRLHPFLDHAEGLITASGVISPRALRLDVGRPTGRDLLNGADLDNYLKPLASRLNDPGLVSVWCTKQYGEHSFVRIEPAREVPPRLTGVVVARPTASYETAAYKEQVQASLANAAELPAGPVRLELAFHVGPDRKWWHLWKPTIDSLEPVLGRDRSEIRPWHPRDGRITELGLHLTVDPKLRHEVAVGIVAARVHTIDLRGENRRYE